MRKKILFVADIYLDKNLGIKKKCLSQIKALSKKNDVIYFLREKEGVLNRILFFYKILKNIKHEKIDFLYFRYSGAFPWVIQFLNKIKQNNKNCKIILELPDYPYQKSIISFKGKIFLVLDEIFNKFLKKYVDIIFYLGNDDIKEIFGIPAIQMGNGIDLKITLLKKHITLNNELNFIGVANLSFGHAYDRFIKSMYEYYKKNNNINVNFYIVGDGLEKQNLMKLVGKLKLQDKVIFTGLKNGTKLDNLFNQSHVAVSLLGAFRLGYKNSTPLKNAEYCARGIPFVLGCNDYRFKNVNFVYNIENNENLFDIEKIIDWYKKNNFDNQEIRRYAEENLTWEHEFKEVFKFINNEQK